MFESWFDWNIRTLPFREILGKLLLRTVALITDKGISQRLYKYISSIRPHHTPLKFVSLSSPFVMILPRQFLKLMVIKKNYVYIYTVSYTHLTLPTIPLV